MPRVREFDPDKALEAAMRLFWRKGFGKTSYEDLVAVTGVSRKGLYAAFGEKDALFLEVLKLYRRTFARELFTALDAVDIQVADVKELVRRIARRIVVEETRQGCLVANASLDVFADSSDVRREIAAHLRRMTRQFSAALRRSGLEPPRCRTAAHYLTAVVQGIFLLGRSRAPREVITDYVRIALDAPLLDSGTG